MKIYMPSCLHAFMPSCLHAFMPSCLHACFPASKSFQGLFSIIFIFLFLTSCEHSKDSIPYSNNSELAIKSTNGFFLAADRNLNNLVLANRSKIGDWEKFTLQKHHDNRITLRSSDNTYLGVPEDSTAQLFAGFKDVRKNTYFKLIKADSTGTYIQDYLNRFLTIDSHFHIRTTEIQNHQFAQFYITEIPTDKFYSFSMNQTIPLHIGILFTLISLGLFLLQKYQKFSILFLLLGALAVRLFVGLLDGHLAYWDEQFHALVAKNAMIQPFKPMLYMNPILPYDETNWVQAHVWLHKQPLFLWQMALSMKIFGITEFGLRLPSIIMSTIIVAFIYRIGKHHISERAGYFAAILFAWSNFVIEITAGFIHTDHNDIAFLFYVTASIWAWTEYEKSTIANRKKLFIILIGVFAGCAVMNKWLTGLLVYAGWGLSIFLSNIGQMNLIKYRDLMVSFMISFCTFIPWQIYIYTYFPKISHFENQLNTRHFFEVIEDHGGNFWWHINQSFEIYKIDSFVLILCIVGLFASIKMRSVKIGLISNIFIIYLFFGIASTKMIAFTFCVSPLIYLGLGNLFEKLMQLNLIQFNFHNYTTTNSLFTLIFCCWISWYNFDFGKIIENHTMSNKTASSFFYQRMKSTKFIKTLPNNINNIREYVFFNCKHEDNIPIMFYTDAIAAYSSIPNQGTLAQILSTGHKVAVFNNGNLPKYLIENQDVIKIDGYWTDF